MMRIFAGLACIACAACTHAPAGEAPAGRAFACSGAEPFWSLDIDAYNATLKTPDDHGIQSADMAGEWVDVDLSDGAVEWRGQGVSYAITRRQCFSEAGTEFEFETDLAALFPRSPAAPGCCRRVR